MHLSQTKFNLLCITLSFSLYIPYLSGAENPNLPTTRLTVGALSSALSPQTSGKFRKGIEPDQIIDIQSLKKSLKRHPKFTEKLIASSMLISPQQDRLIVGAEGDVYQLNLDSPFRNQSLEWLHNHSHCEETTPLLTIAQTPEKFVIASACNYYSRSNKRLQSNVVINFGRYQEVKNFDFESRCIKINNNGNLLAVTGNRTVHLLNLEHSSDPNSITTAPFLPAMYDETNPIVDMCFTLNNCLLILVSQKGTMKIMTIPQLGGASEVQCNAKFHNIHLPIEEKIIAHLCPTPKESTQSTQHVVGLFDLGKIADANTSLVPYETIILSIKRENIVLSNSDEIITAHWTSNDDAEERLRHSIKICHVEKLKQNDETGLRTIKKKNYYLSAPQQEKSYTVMIKSRTERFNSRFFNVALCNNMVVAIGSSGKLFIWNLPLPKQEEYCGFMTTPSDTLMETLKESPTERSTEPRLTRKRSNSANPFATTNSEPSGTTTTPPYKKPSTDLIKSAPGSRTQTPKRSPKQLIPGSKSSSSKSSRKTSPREERGNEK